MRGIKKSGLIAGLLALSTFITSCDGEIADTFSELWTKLLWIGSLGFFGTTSEGQVVGFMRIAIIILVFVILNEVGKFFTKGKSVGAVGTVSLIIAVISGMFISGDLLTTIGSTYGTIVAFILIGVPVGLGFYAILRIPKDTKPQRFLRLVIMILMLLILISIKSHAGDLTGPLQF